MIPLVPCTENVADIYIFIKIYNQSSLILKTTTAFSQSDVSTQTFVTVLCKRNNSKEISICLFRENGFLSVKNDMSSVNESV